MKEMPRRGFLKVLAGVAVTPIGIKAAHAAEFLQQNDAVSPYSDELTQKAVELLYKKDTMHPCPDEVTKKVAELDSIYRLYLGERMAGHDEDADKSKLRLQELLKETDELIKRWERQKRK